MSKRLPNLPAWQWRGYHHNHRNPTNLVLHLIAVPLFILGVLLVLSGLFSLDLGQLAVGIIALIAGLGLQRQGTAWKPNNPSRSPTARMPLAACWSSSSSPFRASCSAVPGGVPGASVIAVKRTPTPSGD